ncbi:MAG TPA: hypothetical protein HPP77_02695 [Candidatus Hydrogenedentes bacterium]|nr:hypothetical protein [Candidatus Hydrogenedentota bacterium]
MNAKNKKYDMNAPGTKACIDKIVHGAFMKEGTMVAFPTCFPGASVPIVADESHITALDVTPAGIVYGGTSGKRTHVFVGMFHGVTGVVFDLGIVEGGNHCPAVCCGEGRFLACVNGAGGGRVILCDLQPLPFDLIQEWGFRRPTFQDLGEVVPGEPIVHAVADTSSGSTVGATTHNLFVIDMTDGHIEVIGEVPGAGRLAVASQGTIVGFDGATHLWRYDPRARQLGRKAIELPKGVWDTAPRAWARDPHSGLLYTADNTGRLFSFDEARGFSAPLGQTALTPVGPMAVTLDGRVFGFCGPEISRMFCYNPATADVADLGVAVSVIERRRYGYVFGDAVTGRDGEIVFGEDDDLGHLWLYFPRIAKHG